ncbi:MAG TPA: CHRD domain-containing protein [Symbiobacteriaceae bacterium]|nr:CHRD domain-containing protein [Symbiobacteriaceae bacterium]
MAGQIQTGAPQQFPFSAVLAGAMEVPPVPSLGSGTALLGFDSTLSTIRVFLTVSNLSQVTAAHIHLGRPGQNGPIVLFLFGPSPGINIGAPAVLTNASFTAANLTGPLAGMPLSMLARAIFEGNAYVNVHTVANPNGEIRGQIQRRI